MFSKSTIVSLFIAFLTATLSFAAPLPRKRDIGSTGFSSDSNWNFRFAPGIVSRQGVAADKRYLSTASPEWWADFLRATPQRAASKNRRQFYANSVASASSSQSAGIDKSVYADVLYYKRDGVSGVSPNWNWQSALSQNFQSSSASDTSHANVAYDEQDSTGTAPDWDLTTDDGQDTSSNDNPLVFVNGSDESRRSDHID